MDLTSKIEAGQTKLSKKALATGAYGFNGLILCRHLQERGVCVIGLVTLKCVKKREKQLLII